MIAPTSTHEVSAPIEAEQLAAALAGPIREIAQLSSGRVWAVTFTISLRGRVFELLYLPPTSDDNREIGRMGGPLESWCAKTALETVTEFQFVNGVNHDGEYLECFGVTAAEALKGCIAAAMARMSAENPLDAIKEG